MRSLFDRQVSISSETARVKSDDRSNLTFLFAFIVIFPLVFVPWALFVERPGVLSDSIRVDLMERFFYLPKLIVFSLFALLAGLETRKGSWRNPWTVLLCLHGLVVLLSSMNAQDELTFMLLGGAQRFDGTVYQVALVLFGVFVFQTLQRTPHGIRWLLHALVIASSVQAVLVVLQRMGIDLVAANIRWMAFHGPGGSIGHHGMLAGFLLPVAVVALWLLLHARNWREKAWLGLGLALTVLAMSVISNRSSIIGLAVGLVVVILRRRDFVTFVLATVVLLMALFAKPVVPVGNNIYTDLTATLTLQTRTMIWPLTWRAIQGIRGQPLIGGGPDAFRLWLLRARPVDELVKLNALELGWPKNTVVSSARMSLQPGLPIRDTLLTVKFKQFGEKQNLEERYTTDLDRAHNYLLDRFVAFGGLSALVWLGLFMYPVVRWLPWLFRPGNVVPRTALGASPQDGTLGFGLVAAIVGLSVYYLTWFPVMQTEPLILVLLAAAWVLVPQRTMQPDGIELGNEGKSQRMLF